MARKQNAQTAVLEPEETETPEEQQPETDKAEPFPIGSRAKVVKVTDAPEWPEFVELIGKTGEVVHHTALGTTVVKFEGGWEFGFFEDELEAVTE